MKTPILRTSIYLDKHDREIIDSFPRGVSMNSIFRCLLRAASVSDEKEWDELLENDVDLRNARDEIKRRLKGFGRRTIAL
jgi:hypothetical protein